MLVRNGGSQKLNVTRNQQWSITALSNSSNGSIVERYTYDEFGKRTILAPNGSTVRTSSSYNNPYGYTSRRHDSESSLMYFRTRYYDPSTGEFISLDPLEYVDGMSLYRAYFVPGAVDPEGASIQKCQCAYSVVGASGGGGGSGGVVGSPFFTTESCQTACCGTNNGEQAGCGSCEGKTLEMTVDQTDTANICDRLKNSTAGLCSACTGEDCEKAIVSILNAIENTWIIWTWPNTCTRWANDCHRRMPGLESNPCVSLAYVGAENMSAYGGLTNGHQFVVIVFCDGTTVKIDNGAYGGGDDHIFPRPKPKQ